MLTAFAGLQGITSLSVLFATHPPSKRTKKGRSENSGLIHSIRRESLQQHRLARGCERWGFDAEEVNSGGYGAA